MSPMISSFNIVPISADDLPSIVALEKECGLSSRGVEGYRKKMMNPNAILLAAISGDEIVGLFSGDVVVDELQIDNVAVRESCRRKGVGQMLLRSALSNASRLGAVTAVLEVRSANLAACALYKKQGFIVVGVRKDYYGAPRDDALLFARIIDGLAL
jgi:ribosomal-protein-alanine N-acetyltransferase